MGAVIIATSDVARRAEDGEACAETLRRTQLDLSRPWSIAPVTVVYTVMLVVTTVFLPRTSVTTQNRFLFDISTNLHNLLHWRIDTLLSSAVAIADRQWEVLVVLTCTMLAMEIRLGSRRVLEGFLLGHVGASVLVALGLYMGIRAHWWTTDVVMDQDYGVSYGAMALVGLVIVLWSARLRIWWSAAWLLFAAFEAAKNRDYTSVGHLLSLTLGLTAGYLLIQRSRARNSLGPTPPIPSQALLAVPSALLGFAMLW